MSDSTATTPRTSVLRSTSSSEFFDGTARGELLLRRCSDCAHVRLARRPICRACGSEVSEYIPAQGSGEVITWAANPPSRNSSNTESTLFGMVELTEGPWIETLLIDIAADDLWVGKPVAVSFVRGTEGEAYPVFGPSVDTDDDKPGEVS